jgi:hypothetical protein
LANPRFSIFIGSPVSKFGSPESTARLLLRHNPLSGVPDLLKWGTSNLYAGADVARSSLAALVSVHVLRAFLASTQQPEGWLGALADPEDGLRIVANACAAG